MFVFLVLAILPNDTLTGFAKATKTCRVLEASKFEGSHGPWTGRDFLFDIHFVQPLARFKVQKFAEVTKFDLDFKSAPQRAAGECFI